MIAWPAAYGDSDVHDFISTVEASDANSSTLPLGSIYFENKTGRIGAASDLARPCCRQQAARHARAG